MWCSSSNHIVYALLGVVASSGRLYEESAKASAAGVGPGPLPLSTKQQRGQQQAAGRAPTAPASQLASAWSSLLLSRRTLGLLAGLHLGGRLLQLLLAGVLAADQEGGGAAG